MAEESLSSYFDADETLLGAFVPAVDPTLDPTASVPDQLRDNRVVARLMAEAARRRAEADETLVGGALDAPEAVEPILQSEDWQAAIPDPAESRTFGDEVGLLRGAALALVGRGALSERRAVSIGLQAQDAGVGFMRALAADRSNVDLRQAYTIVGEMLEVEPLLDRTAAIQRLAETEWLSASLAEQWQILPLAQEEASTVIIAAVDPFDLVARDWARRQSGAESVIIVPIHPDAFFETLRRYQAMQQDVAETDGMFTPISVSWTKEDVERADLSHFDVPAVVNYILHRGYEEGASDIHLEPTGDGLLVRNRVDGVLREEIKLPRHAQTMLVSRVKVLANLDVAERRMPQDGRIGVMIQDHPVDIRVSSLPTVHGEKLVLRLLDEGALRPRLDDIGMPSRELRTLLDNINAPFGLILLSGPTGSGKTTTLYSCLSTIDRLGRNVVTVEDPVEYRLKGVHQTQVDENLGLTFAGGLRAILRQDPDVIMVGECRDPETAQMAVQASLTGHLVFSTIHANDAVGVVSRLIDMGVDPFLVANSVSMSLAQRLVRVHCPHCQTVVDGRDVLANLRAEGVSLEKLEHLKINIAPDLPAIVTLGCGHCRHAGYVGRQPVFEALALDDETRTAIMDEKFNTRSFRRFKRERGMQSMLEHALTLVEEGRTSYSEVVRVLGEA
ncbi:MAG: GspE/PulE family protein [Alphaproteobacteria bacterium]